MGVGNPPSLQGVKVQIAILQAADFVPGVLCPSMAASIDEVPAAGGFGLGGLALLRGNSLLSNERQDDPVTFDDEEWQLSTVLGTGTSSTVFAAHKILAHQSEPTRAVKVIMVELMGTSERAELRLEYELWSQLHHPHIIQMHNSVLSEARYRRRPHHHHHRPRRRPRPPLHCPRRHCPKRPHPRQVLPVARAGG